MDSLSWRRMNWGHILPCEVCRVLIEWAVDTVWSAALPVYMTKCPLGPSVGRPAPCTVVWRHHFAVLAGEQKANCRHTMVKPKRHKSGEPVLVSVGDYQTWGGRGEMLSLTQTGATSWFVRAPGSHVIYGTRACKKCSWSDSANRCHTGPV